MNFLAIFQRLRQIVVDIWQRTEKRDRNRFFVISGVSAAVIIVALVLLTRTTYVELAPAASLDDVSRAEITTALTGQGFRHKRGTDGSIMVPEKSFQDAYSYLTLNGIPSSGNRNYDTYSLGNGMTATSEQTRQYKIWQDEEHIRSTICKINGIRDADVKIAIPKDTLSIIRTDQSPPTASIQLITEDGSEPSRDIVRSVKALTAYAIEGLLPENVAVSCQTGMLLDSEEDGYSRYGDQLALTNRLEVAFEQAVRVMFDPLLGYKNYNIKAHVEIDDDIHITDKLTYDPVIDENGIIQSMQTVAEIAQGGGLAAGEPGEDENGGGDTYSETETGLYDYYEKNTSTVNYLVSEIREHLEKVGYDFKNLTFSLTVNSAVIPGDQSFTNQLKSIIGGALGLGSSEYGRISVMYAEFQGLKDEEDLRIKWEAEQRRKELMEILRIIVLYLVIGVCVILLILKTYGLLKREPTEEELLAGAISEGYDPEMDEIAALVEMATLGEITEAPKSPFREQIEKFIDKNPTAVAELLRNWLNEEFK